MKQEPLPQIHLVRDTDLGVFAYELHILAGDFLRESEFNLHALAANTGPDSIAVMGKKHMWLSDALPRRTWAHLTGWSAGRRTGSWEYIRSLIKYRDAAHPRSGDFL